MRAYPNEPSMTLVAASIRSLVMMKAARSMPKTTVIYVSEIALRRVGFERTCSHDRSKEAKDAAYYMRSDALLSMVSIYAFGAARRRTEHKAKMRAKKARPVAIGWIMPKAIVLCRALLAIR